MSLREFIVSSGFVAVALLVVAFIVLGLVLFAVARAGKRHDQELEQRERHHQELRDAEQQAQTSQQSWRTLRWLVETAGIEPAAGEGATLGLGPEVTMATLRGLLRDAERLGDETLADAVTAYQNQFALVLAQQGGPLAELAGGGPAAAGERKPQPQQAPKEPQAKTPSARPADDKGENKPAPDDNPTPATELAGDGRRHRR